MKKAKNIFLILGAILNILLFGGFLFLGIAHYIMPGLIDKILVIVNNLLKFLHFSIKHTPMLAIIFFVVAGVELFSAVLALIARKKAKPSVYVLTLLFNLVKAFDIFNILGCVFGIISYRNGDELTVN